LAEIVFHETHCFLDQLKNGGRSATKKGVTCHLLSVGLYHLLHEGLQRMVH
jgi:hypothetical protein